MPSQSGRLELLPRAPASQRKEYHNSFSIMIGVNNGDSGEALLDSIPIFHDHLHVARLNPRSPRNNPAGVAPTGTKAGARRTGTWSENSIQVGSDLSAAQVSAEFSGKS